DRLLHGRARLRLRLLLQDEEERGGVSGVRVRGRGELAGPGELDVRRGRGGERVARHAVVHRLLRAEEATHERDVGRVRVGEGCAVVQELVAEDLVPGELEVHRRRGRRERIPVPEAEQASAGIVLVRVVLDQTPLGADQDYSVTPRNRRGGGIRRRRQVAIVLDEILPDDRAPLDARAEKRRGRGIVQPGAAGAVLRGRLIVV